MHCYKALEVACYRVSGHSYNQPKSTVLVSIYYDISCSVAVSSIRQHARLQSCSMQHAKCLVEAKLLSTNPQKFAVQTSQHN